MFRRMLSIAALCAYAVAKIASADVLVGDFRGVASPGPVLRFGAEQDGNRAPLASLTTQQDGNVLLTPLYLAYEPVEDVVYVSDFYGRAIRVYPAGASGNVAPLRTLTGPLGQPRHVAVDVAHDEIFVITSTCCVSTFARTADGNASALRQIFWRGAARLNNPGFVYYLAATDEIVVADYTPSPDSRAVLLFFARTASGDVAPTRTIEGASTLLGTGIVGLAHVPGHAELVALTVDADGAYRMVTFAQNASGNVAPMRVVEGPALGIENAGAIAYDAATDRIYALSGTYNSTSQALVAFPRTATGNVAPVRRVAGPRTMLAEPTAIAAVPPGDWIFADGFNDAD